MSNAMATALPGKSIFQLALTKIAAAGSRINSAIASDICSGCSTPWSPIATLWPST